MKLLDFITRAISAAGYDSHPGFMPVLTTATKLREGSDGAKAQAFADEIYPLLEPLLPALGQYSAIVAVCEKHVGETIEVIETLGGAVVAAAQPTLADAGAAEPVPDGAPAVDPLV